MCVSRPRRFGKSMAANMLAAYYDKSCDSLSLFKNLKIAQNPEFKNHLNKYDIIHLGYLGYIASTSEVFIPNLEIANEFKNAAEGSAWTDVIIVINQLC